jgi:hypothetical protein
VADRLRVSPAGGGTTIPTPAGSENPALVPTSQAPEQELQLASETEGDFRIVAHQPDAEPQVAASGVTRWSWTVAPERLGRRKLVLSVFKVVDVPDYSYHQSVKVEQYEAEILVEEKPWTGLSPFEKAAAPLSDRLPQIAAALAAVAVLATAGKLLAAWLGRSALGKRLDLAGRLGRAPREPPPKM